MKLKIDIKGVLRERIHQYELYEREDVSLGRSGVRGPLKQKAFGLCKREFEQFLEWIENEENNESKM